MNKLFLNKCMYPKITILTAIKAFSSLCSIKLFEQNKYYICEFNNCTYGMTETKKEFENYLIDLINTDSLI